jgi:hypothetical protein
MGKEKLPKDSFGILNNPCLQAGRSGLPSHLQWPFTTASIKWEKR